MRYFNIKKLIFFLNLQIKCQLKFHVALFIFELFLKNFIKQNQYTSFKV